MNTTVIRTSNEESCNVLNKIKSNFLLKTKTIRLRKNTTEVRFAELGDLSNPTIICFTGVAQPAKINKLIPNNKYLKFFITVTP